LWPLMMKYKKEKKLLKMIWKKDEENIKKRQK
jgi:hypothetical protein